MHVVAADAVISHTGHRRDSSPRPRDRKSETVQLGHRMKAAYAHTTAFMQGRMQSACLPSVNPALSVRLCPATAL